jgi:heat shock protein HtpX
MVGIRQNGGAAMVRTRYAPDRGLQARMGLTMFLLGLVFVAFVTALVFVLIALKQGAGAIIFFAVVLGAVLVFGSLFWSDKVALRASGAQEVTPEQAPQLHGIIDRLCALANMSKPRVAIAQTDMPNAFATGRNSKNAVLVVTTGLMRRLDDKELEGVLAHEMSHVAHKDVVVMTIASFVGILAGLLVRFAFYGELFGGGGRGRGGGNNNNGGALPILLIVMAVGIVTYAISFLLIRLLSRYRELAADRAGALLTGQPSALASALTKVSGAMARIPTQDLRQAQPLNAFYFAPALKPNTTSLSTVFSTHPSLERRLQQLSDISAQLGKQQ